MPAVKNSRKYLQAFVSKPKNDSSPYKEHESEALKYKTLHMLITETSEANNHLP